MDVGLDCCKSPGNIPITLPFVELIASVLFGKFKSKDMYPFVPT